MCLDSKGLSVESSGHGAVDVCLDMCLDTESSNTMPRPFVRECEREDMQGAVECGRKAVGDDVVPSQSLGN